MEAYRFTHAAAYPIPLYRPAQRAADGQADANRPRSFGFVVIRPALIKSGQMSRKMATPIFVHATEIRVLEQVRRLRKFGSRSAAHG